MALLLLVYVVVLVVVVVLFGWGPDVVILVSILEVFRRSRSSKR